DLLEIRPFESGIHLIVFPDTECPHRLGECAGRTALRLGSGPPMLNRGGDRSERAHGTIGDGIQDAAVKSCPRRARHLSTKESCEMYLPGNASRARVREAENARRNRAEILKAWSQGQVSRRDLFKMGLFTAAGAIVLKNGLSPFARSAYADDSSIPTGLPRSPLFGVQPFTQPMPRFDVLPRNPVSALSPAPTAQANTTQQPLNTALEGVGPGQTGPIEGRPPGPTAFWTFNGTFPPKLMQVRYGEPVLFRNRNKLPYSVTQNGGFGRHTTSIHEHNGHHGAENDGFTGAYFFPGQFYDYHYPIVLAGWRNFNAAASDPRAGSPADNGGIHKGPRGL